MQQHGLLHESEGHTQRLHVQLTDDPATLSDADVMIFSCKMTSLENLIQSLQGKLRAETLLVTLQNGLEAAEWVSRAFPTHAVAAGPAFIGARLAGPGHVIHSAAGGMRLGLWQPGAGGHLLAELIEQLKKGGVAARLDSDPATMLWRKLLWNSGFNAITAITKRFAKQICEDEKRLAIARSAMEETVAVAQAQGITIGEDDIQAQIDVTLTMGPVKTSMWQDIEAGHKTEVEYINGVVVRRGDQRGISVVTNRMLLQEIQAIEGI